MLTKFNTIAWKAKFLAFAVHFGISLLIFLVLLYLILFVWYPYPFFTTDGGTQGLRLIIFVDLVLGPTLTFVVFNRQKKSLKLDLSVIAIIQILGLSYGIWAVHHERPMAVVFSDDRFNPIPYYQLTEAGIALTDLKQYGDDKPVKIFVELPADRDARASLFLESYRRQQPVYLMGDRYRKFDADINAKLVEQSIDMERYLQEAYLNDRSYLAGKVENMRATYQQFVASSSRPVSEYLFLALFARHGKFIVVVDRETLEFVEVLDMLPPQITKYVADRK